MYWQRIEQIKRKRDKDPRQAQLREVLGDTDLKDDAKEQRAGQLREVLRARYDELHQEAVEQVQKARESWIRHMPLAIQRREAGSKPDRMAWGRMIGETAMGPELLQNARMAVEAKDGAGAYGMRLALQARKDIDQKLLRQLLSTLDQADTTGWEGTLSNLLAAQVALAEFEVGGPEGDGFAGVRADPVKALSMFRRAAAIPTNEEGDTRYLSDQEVTVLLGKAGMREAPEDPGEPVTLDSLRASVARAPEPAPAA